MSLHSNDYVELANVLAGLATVTEVVAPAGTTGDQKRVAVVTQAAQALPTIVQAIQATQQPGEDKVGNYASAIVGLLNLFSGFFKKPAAVPE